MTQYVGERIYTFSLDSNASNEKEFLANNQEQIIDKLISFETNIRSDTTETLSQIRKDKTELTVSPTRIRIELNEGFAIISVIK